MRDKSYRSSSLGQLVGRYLRWFRNEWGATEATLRDYESVLSKMSLRLAHLDPIEVEIEDLRAVIDDYWGDASARTRQKVTSVVRAFWTWVESESLVPFSPAARLKRPRAPRPVTPLLPANADARLLAAATEPRDRVALLCLLDLGLRRGGVAGLQARHFDLARRVVTVTEKGQKARTLPLRGRIVLELEHWLLAPLVGVERQPEPDDFLLYSVKRFNKGKVVRGYPKQRPSVQYVHRWWYRRLEAAGLVGEGVRSGLNMHRARHSFAVDLRRVAGIDAASHALGHSDLSTTLSTYGHRDASDLDRDMEDYARWREETSGESFPLRTPENGLSASIMEAAGIEPASPVGCGRSAGGPGLSLPRRRSRGVDPGSQSRARGCDERRRSPVHPSRPADDLRSSARVGWTSYLAGRFPGSAVSSLPPGGLANRSLRRRLRLVHGLG